MNMSSFSYEAGRLVKIEVLKVVLGVVREGVTMCVWCQGGGVVG